MNKYELKIIKYTLRSADELNKAIDDAEPIICYGLKDVWNKCGGKLPRQRHGYAGTDGFYEFFARKI